MRSDSGDRTPLNIVSTAHYLPRRGKKKTKREHDLNQDRIHGWPKYYKKNRKNKWHSQINRYPTSLSSGQWMNRLLTVIFPVDSNPPLEQLGPYRALEAHYKPLLPRQIRPCLSPRASSQCQTMDEPRWNEKKLVEGTERKKLLGTSPTVFLFNLGPAVRAAALFLHLFTKHEPKTHTKKPAGDLDYEYFPIFPHTNLLPTLSRSYKDE